MINIGAMDAITHPPAPTNEPNLSYAPGSPERAALEAELAKQSARTVNLPATIGGRRRMGGGAEFQVVQPHDHAAVVVERHRRRKRGAREEQ